ncbi:hypothetical protein DFH11DRAFT_1513916, partial [Phellopilus nigrolimitatus]
FETTLKEVVNGKRLSASKMAKLTEISMKLMEHDTQLVSILYRTHKSLPIGAKTSSLYCFDALCRAARHQVTKQNLSGNIHAEKGNCATFLLKIEGVLDGLFQDINSSGISEAKEKTKKILDIWTKSNTFPANVLTRLTGQVRTAENPKASSGTTTTDPRKHPTPPSEVTPPPAAIAATPTVESAQAALLALLSSAAAANNASGSQTTTNTSSIQANSTPPQSQLEQIQLVLLQQLANKTSAGIGNVAPPFVPAQQTLNFPSSSSRSPPNPESYASLDRRDPRFSRFEDAPAGGLGRGRGTPYDDRRGGFRGNPPPRENFRGRRNHEHDRQHSWGREKDDHWEPPNRGRISRSRSPPPRGAGRRDGRPYSPPRRPSVTTPTEVSRAVPGAPEVGKDEFGRDIRAPSEDPEGKILPASSTEGDARGRSMSVHEGADASYEQVPETPSGNVTPIANPNDSSLAHSGGLESFDLASFDPTNAASWKALGDAFEVTNGYLPSQEELMNLVMSGMGMAMGMGMGGMGGVPAPPVPGAGFATGLGQNTGRGVGAQEWAAGAYDNRSNNQGSDAVILGPSGAQAAVGTYGKGGAQSNSGPNSPVEHQIPSPSAGGGGGGGAGGQMRKVGDRWMFVRDAADT